MLNCYSIILSTDNGKREILVSPLLLHSKEPHNLRSGNISRLFFYENWIDEAYKENLRKEFLSDKFNDAKYLINYGQEFSTYYIGTLQVDFDNKHYWGWEGMPGKLNDKEIRSLGSSLFNADAESRVITLFTPTRPSDINF